MTTALDMLTGWPSQLDELFGRISGEFARAEPRRQARKYLEGLLGGAKRKNGWQLAEQIGDARPWRTQRVLSHVLWDQDRVRDVCRAYIVEQLGRDGVLIVDETGFLKKGEHSVGVARQYSGTAGRIDNCQVGVFLAYATERGHALIDRRLYLPEDWLDDEHRREGRIPADVAFATKPAMARAMIAQALDAGVPCGWVAADALYGSDKSLRVLLEQRAVPYVLAVRGNEVLNVLTAEREFLHLKASALADLVPEDGWKRLSAGVGAKGQRYYDWARLRLFRLQEPLWDHWLLIRRNRKNHADKAYYVTFGPMETTLADLVRVAGRRWAIEECFEIAKQDCGLADYEVRSWHGWYRHITLAMLALAFLAAMRRRLNVERGAAAVRHSSRLPTACRRSATSSPPSKGSVHPGSL
ncbi:Mobile element protein [Azospirillum argentinense]|uniref:Transposase IS701-like DDE domain-containing protein n=2 Tax=Azospirillum argentinense TaxID=2970906 RepID=A0A5B0KMD1_9PROT|nr:Mobile element protein [Azospirillum argentinense]